MLRATTRAKRHDGPYFEPLEEYVDHRGEWLARCAFLLTEDHEASRHLLRATMVAAWRFYDWVSAAEDPERYVLRILLNEFRVHEQAEKEGQRAVVVLRYWANFGDGRVAEMLGCRKATVRTLAADALRDATEQQLRDALGGLARAAVDPDHLLFARPPNRF
ncbi:MAG TPA: hypothetical protein VNQ53_13130 [Nocardioides sp.]|nr:hypothetical protein [Nocardioides sp.]